MNPLKWKLAHQIALAIGAALGAIGGLLVGYSVAARNTGWHYWAFENSMKYSWPWLIGGLLVGAAVVYAMRLARS